jgi:hypothetical protein
MPKKLFWHEFKYLNEKIQAENAGRKYFSTHVDSVWRAVNTKDIELYSCNSELSHLKRWSFSLAKLNPLT